MEKNELENTHVIIHSELGLTEKRYRIIFVGLNMLY